MNNKSPPHHLMILSHVKNKAVAILAKVEQRQPKLFLYNLSNNKYGDF